MSFSIHKPAPLARIRARTAELGFGMASEDLVGALLRTLVASKPGGSLLELGTGTGVATAWMLDGMDAGSRLTTIDPDKVIQSVVREALGTDSRLHIICGDGAEFLRTHPSSSFDLVFADAMPGKYEVLPEALRVVKPGGFYVIDDMLPQPNWPEGHQSRVDSLLATLSELDDFFVAPISWASGVVVAVRTSVR